MSGLSKKLCNSTREENCQDELMPQRTSAIRAASGAILYCSSGLNGLDSLLFEGAKEEKGLPSQTKVLKALLDSGNEVHIIAGKHAGQTIDIGPGWLNEAASLSVVEAGGSLKTDLTPKNIARRALFFIRFNFAVRKALAKHRFDLVYLHGEQASMAAKEAHAKGVPCGQRAYGSLLGQLPSGSRERWFLTRLRYPHTFSALKLKKDFVIATKDGSEVDKLALRVCKKTPPYDLYLWSNGVDFLPCETLNEWDEERLSLKQRFMFCGARIDKSKNQLFAINVLHYLKCMGIGDLHLVLAGEVSDPVYHSKLVAAVERYDLDDRVHFLGSVQRSLVLKLHRLSVASFSTYDNYSRGNSFLEGMAVGAVSVVLRGDRSVADLVVDGVSGLCVEDEQEAARRVASLLNDKELSDRIRVNARKKTEEIVPSWDERVAQELDLIHYYIEKNHERRSH